MSGDSHGPGNVGDRCKVASVGGCGCDAEKTVAVFLEVLPRMIVEAAEDFRNAWLDGRSPDLTEEKLRARLERIVAGKFPV